ncbi:hypothetical protein [Flexivirga oryzae]|uniref:Uncharacterized protein n=1 Tax=Flexivirga oryzae TaxID=1794944 RepID=A0A839N475_9MICO|nr:hypothetical protein [Flexivirga oryzae]MBB2892538.1 hypothetical protein [Flexivirga oryzae]
MKIVSRTAAAALLITLPMALGACSSSGGSKPAKADVQAGFTKALKGQSEAKGAPDSLVNKMSGCVVDKIYNKVSNKTLNAIKSGDTSNKISSDDESTLNDATNSCGKSLVSAAS